jgi:hypothetical protein
MGSLLLPLPFSFLLVVEQTTSHQDQGSLKRLQFYVKSVMLTVVLLDVLTPPTHGDVKAHLGNLPIPQRAS